MKNVFFGLKSRGKYTNEQATAEKQAPISLLGAVVLFFLYILFFSKKETQAQYRNTSNAKSQGHGNFGRYVSVFKWVFPVWLLVSVKHRRYNPSPSAK